MEKDLELCFEDFIESKDVDVAEDALFAALRQAFIAGWKAAGGKMPDYKK